VEIERFLDSLKAKGIHLKAQCNPNGWRIIIGSPTPPDERTQAEIKRRKNEIYAKLVPEKFKHYYFKLNQKKNFPRVVIPN